MAQVGGTDKKHIFYDDTIQYLFDCCQPGGAAMNKPPSRRKKAKPYLSSLQAKLLATVEREYKIEWRQQK
ncbi:hypothetical protein FM036_39020 [Nostoc sp. HG1]|nr:hypothetical protein [Nostoc sp. HG1]